MTTPAYLLLEGFDDLLAAPQDIERLNQAILQLAVQGKLVPQNPNDEPATELLKRISADRQGQMQQIPLLPLTDNEIPFALPKGWAWTKIGNLYDIFGGGTPSTKVVEYWEGTVPWITSADILGPRLIRPRKTINETAIEHSATTLVPAGSIIVVTRVGLGKVALTSFPLCFSQDSQALVGNRDHVYPDYALYCLLTASQGFRKHSRGTTIFGITKSQLVNLPFPLPPYQEQMRIASQIEQLFAQTRRLAELLSRAQADLTHLNGSAIAHLLDAQTPEEFAARWAFIAEHFDLLYSDPAHVAPLRQAILELAVQGKLTRQDPKDEPASELLKRIKTEKERLVEAGKIPERDPLSPIRESEKPFELPKGWEWARFAELGELERGRSRHRPRNAPFLYEDGKYPFVQTGNVAQSQGRITTYSAMYGERGLAQSHMWEKGTLCITIAANIAETGILEFDACFPDSVVGFVPSHLLGTADYFQYFVKVAKSKLESYAPATAQKNINLGILRKLLIPLPPANEIKRIVSRVEQLMSLCDALEAKLKAAQVERERLVEAVVAEIAAGA
jgi:type I restriction enzyme S subunit